MPLLLLAIAPSIAIILLFYLKDKYEKEPVRLLLGTFILGMLTILPVAWIESYLFEAFDVDILHPSSLLMSLTSMLFFVALVEEGAKFLVVRGYVWRKKEFDEPYDGIMYGVMAALGFATVENILYVLSQGATVGWLRAFLTVPMHALTGVIMGYYIGSEKYPKSKDKFRQTILYGLGSAVFFHGFFNFFVGSNIIWLILIAPLLVGIAWRLAFKASRIHAEASPHKSRTYSNSSK